MKLLTLLASLLTTSAVFGAETYELKVYHLNSAESAGQWDAWMSASGLANIRKSGADKVGAFKAKPEEGAVDHRRFVLSVYPSPAALQSVDGAAVLPKQGNRQAEAYLAALPKEPAYTRVESSLLTAFPSFTQLVDPAGDGGKARFFELRVYENPSERAAALKVEMFGQGGEIDVFREVGLKPVFFGSARIAANLPQLTYMVVHENDDALKAAWGGFRTSKTWAKLKTNLRYKGTVSKIHRHLLVALPFSELK
jgi:hypothetical protein